MEEISKLSVEQVDGEASVLQESLANIRTAATRFEMPSRALDALSQQSAGMIGVITAECECLFFSFATII